VVLHPLGAARSGLGHRARPRGPATVNALKAVREITVDGRVTVPDVEPPGGRWPRGAVTSGLLFYRDRGWSLWDPRTGEDVRRLDLGGPLGPTHDDVIASCAAEPCVELWLTDARTGRRRIAHAPEGKAFQLSEGAFSPDGRQLATPVNEASASPSESPAHLALVDVEPLTTRIVPGSTVSPYYVFTAWSSDGTHVFITGGERFKPRTVVAYRLGDEAARALDVEVGDFYDIARARGATRRASPLAWHQECRSCLRLSGKNRRCGYRQRRR
jgi:hypothetical protein